MALRKELEITWKGKEYKLMMTFDVINRIDLQVNIGNMFRDEHANNVRITQKAKFIGAVLREAGAKATDEEVYEMLTTAEIEDVNALYTSMMWSCLGDSEDTKKKEAKPRQKKAQSITA